MTFSDVRDGQDGYEQLTIGKTTPLRIFFVAPSYPPYPASGSRRAKHVATAMRRAGHEVHVVTQRLSDETSPNRISEEGLRVETVKPLPTVLDLYGSLKSRLHPADGVADSLPRQVDGNGGDEVGAAHGSDRRTGQPAWKRIVRSFLALPDANRGILTPMLLRGFSAARQSFDLLYSTSPPRLAHVTGLILSRMTGIPWVAEFRDPWVVGGVPYRAPSERSRPADAIERWMESACITGTNLVVTVSRSHLELLQARDSGSAPTRMVMIRNGIPHRVSASPPHPTPSANLPRRTVHLGNIYGHRDPMPFLKALASLHDQELVSEEELQVEFVGDGQAQYEAAVQEMNLDGTVQFRGWVPHNRAQQILDASDLYLLLAQEQPLQVPNKLYEYLGTGKPILAFADADGESARMLRRIGGHYLVTERDPPERVVDTVRAAVVGADTHRMAAEASDPEALLETWSTERQMERLIKLLDQVVSVPSEK